MTAAQRAAEDRHWMRVALGMAARSLGRVAPNPAVGCALVKDGRLLGRGATGDGGRPHAETVALAEAVARYGAAALRGATAYVTLEPCAHHGRTPPCAGALVQAGVARVVCPLQDPDPRVDGRGFAALRDAGIAVETGPMAEDAARLNGGFLSRIRRGRPQVILKLAATLDGRIATAAGESRWITGPEARLRAHLMRARADAVLIGAGTARADDPMLDVREIGGRVHHPVRIVADGGLTLAPESRLAQTARHIPVWVLNRADASAARRMALASLGVVPIETRAQSDGALDMADALARLAGEGLTRVLCEGGGRLAASLIRQGLADEIVLVTAGKAIGGDGAPAVGPMGLARLAEAPGFTLAETERVGADLLSVWRRAVTPGGASPARSPVRSPTAS